jgi:hypothetical protein
VVKALDWEIKIMLSRVIRWLKVRFLLFSMLSLALFCITGCSAFSTPLLSAAATGNEQEVTRLIENGVNINERVGIGANSYTALHEAARNGHASIVALLLKKNATVDEPGGLKRTALWLATANGHTDVVRILLEAGADPARKGYLQAIAGYDRSPLQVAQANGYSNIVTLLTDALNKQTRPSYADSAPSIPNKTTAQSMPSQKDGADIVNNIPAGKQASKYDVAVVIGNANYSASGTQNVDFALQDAHVMRQYLVKTFGYNPSNIIYIENATLAKMYEVFGTDTDYQGKLFKWVKPGQSKVFIYYVGHGAPDQQSGEGYFVPVDANPQYIRTSGYKLSTFYENLSRVPAVKKTVVIDACFSGSSANGQLLKGVSGLTARLKAEPKAGAATDLLLTSAGMDQVASWYPEKGHSLFTYFFLKGIQGAADVNKNGSITMGEMRAWLNDQVPYMARRLTGNEQQPVILGKDGDELVVLTN